MLLVTVFALAASKGPQPINVAVLPPVPIDGKERWLGLAIADNLGSGLLKHGQADKAVKKPPRPLSIFSWRETWSAARNESLDVSRPLSPDSVKKLSAQLGANLIFTGSYKVKSGKNPSVLLKWRVVDVSSPKKPKEFKVQTNLATLSTKTDKLVQAVVKAIGLKPIKTKPAPPTPVAAEKAYAQGLEILSGQSLDPQARVVVPPAELKRARDLFTTAYKTGLSRARIGMVTVSAMQGEQSDVTELIVGLHEAEPLDAMALYYVLARQGKLDAAARVMADVTTVYPGFLAGLGKLGNVYLQANQAKRAAEVFAAYSARVPKNPWARSMYSKALGRAGDYEMAIAEAEAVVNDFPDSISAQANLGVRLTEAKRYTDAVGVLEKALTKHPDQPVLMTRLAYVKLKLNQVDAAYALAKKAVDKIGDGRGHAIVGYAYANLGHALALQGKKQEALAAFNRAAELGVSVEDREALLADPRTKKLLEENKSPLATPPQPSSLPASEPVATPPPAEEAPEQWKDNAEFDEEDDWEEEDFDDSKAPAGAKPSGEAQAEEAM